jgi:hypothetical protein
MTNTIYTTGLLRGGAELIHENKVVPAMDVELWTTIIPDNVVMTSVKKNNLSILDARQLVRIGQVGYSDLHGSDGVGSNG